MSEGVCNHPEHDEPGQRLHETFYKAMVYPWWGLTVLLPMVLDNAFVSTLPMIIPALYLPIVNASGPIYFVLAFLVYSDPTLSNYISEWSHSKWWPISYMPRRIKTSFLVPRTIFLTISYQVLRGFSILIHLKEHTDANP